LATRIDRADCLRIHDLLSARLGVDHGSNGRSETFLTHDNWAVLVSGWGHQEGWSRGFSVGDNDLRNSRGYVSPTHDGGRYEGKGWHARMADDIIAAVEKLRKAAG
jgi:hypothetical protein